MHLDITIFTYAVFIEIFIFEKFDENVILKLSSKSTVH